MYPKFFTPNGDGYNDTWKIKLSDFEEGLTVKIFDRYGKLIKILKSDSDGWNGTYNEQELPATDYWFIVTRADGKEQKGHFSLKR
jgi:gliding motility-associated-like protein